MHSMDWSGSSHQPDGREPGSSRQPGGRKRKRSDGSSNSDQPQGESSGTGGFKNYEFTQYLRRFSTSPIEPSSPTETPTYHETEHGTSSVEQLRQYGNKLANALREKRLYTEFNHIILEKLRDAGLIKSIHLMDDDKRKQFQKILEETSNYVYGKELGTAYKKLLDSLEQKRLDTQFKAKLAPELRDAGLFSMRFQDMGSAERKLFRHMVEEASNYVYGVEVEQDFKKILSSLKKKKLYTQFKSEIEPKVRNIGLVDIKFQNMNSTQREQFRTIVNETLFSVELPHLADIFNNSAELSINEVFYEFE